MNEQLFINLTDTQCTWSYLDAIPDIRPDCPAVEFFASVSVSVAIAVAVSVSVADGELLMYGH